MNIFIAIIASIATVILLGGLYLAWYTVHRNFRQSLERQLKSLLKLTVDNPNLENEKFINALMHYKITGKGKLHKNNPHSFNKDNFRSEYERYDNYCIMVSNYLENYLNYYRFKPTHKLNLAIEEWVGIHKVWFLDNLNSLNSDKFSSYIFHILKKIQANKVESDGNNLSDFIIDYVSSKSIETHSDLPTHAKGDGLGFGSQHSY